MKKRYVFQDEELIFHHTKRESEQWEQFGKLAQETFKPDKWLEYTDGRSGIEAKTFQDAGRRCVYCGGMLRGFEQQEDGQFLTRCESCKRKIWQMDMEPYTKEEVKLMQEVNKKNGAGKEINDIPDRLYRQIPDNLVMQYEDMLKRRRGI